MITLDQLRAELALLRPGHRPELLSKREAARMLGVSRGRTLDAWIADGTIRTIRTPAGRVKIPRVEIERLGTEGAPPKVTKSSTPVRRKVERLSAQEANERLKAMGF